MKEILAILAGIIATVLGIVLLIIPVANLFLWRQIEVPPNEPVEVVWTEQNWTPEQWQWWYHISQGSSFEAVIPYKWFTSLEQPKITLFRPEHPLTDLEFLAGFGFLPDEKNQYNPDALPVGFATTENYLDPLTHQTNKVIGFTCAACHTGQVNYRGKGIRIEGGPSMVELDKFKKSVAFSLFLTNCLPWRFQRFADRVLGENSTSLERDGLKQQLKSLIAQASKVRSQVNSLYTTTEGFSRLDALTRIGNFVFGSEINPDNLREVNAPVNFPHLWSAPWFDWVQYNGSVMQPMTRNAGEAMGVFARANLDADSPDVFESNVNVENIYQIESLLAGSSIFTGLTAPKWPEEILGTIDRDLATKGKRLYAQYCQSCHLPPMNTEAFKDERYWTTLGDDQTREYLKVTMKNLYAIGTDPQAAVNWYQRTVNLGDLARKYLEPKKFENDGIVSAGTALPFVVEKTVEKKYDELQLTAEQREAYNGHRPNLARATLAYKARPLDGIWATAPFLHNGSVPNLYEMLVPASDRTPKFYLGSKEFEPQFVGFKTDKIPGGFLLDSTKAGNSNLGHEFRGEGKGAGVVGPQLSENERWALVEYLKTL